MGVKHSIYENPGTLDYYKFSIEEYALIKRIWSEIAISPQTHGNAYFRSFCETYPQYVKFFTLEYTPKLPISFDMRAADKFSKVFEAMSYLLLDFNNKPKQLDRFVGYIAMVHKDMRLNEQDMNRFMSSLLKYLSQTYPTQMTPQCHDAMSRYMDGIARQLTKKMEIFRCYDIAQLDVVTQLKPWGRCRLFIDPTVFGKTKIYWGDWKKQWDVRLDEWAMQGNSVALLPMAQLNEEDIATTSKVVDDDDDDIETGALQRRASVLLRRSGSDISASRLTLLSMSKIGFDRIDDVDERLPKRRVDKPRSRRIRTSRKPADSAKNVYERRRLKSFVRDVSKPQADATTLRKHSRNGFMDNVRTTESTTDEDSEKPTASKCISEVVRAQSSVPAAPGTCKTARERRRERVNAELQ